MTEVLLLALVLVGFTSWPTVGWVGVEFAGSGGGAPSSFIGPEAGFLAHLEHELGMLAQVELGCDPDRMVPSTIGIDQAWLGFRFGRQADIRVGMLRLPFGGSNEPKTPFFDRLITRPYEGVEISPTPWTDLGVATNGAIEVPFGTLLFSFMLSNGLVMGPTIRESRPLLGQLDNNSDKALTGRLGFSLPVDAQVGISGYFGARDPDNRKNLGMLGLDGAIRAKGFELSGEYAGALLDTELGVLRSIQFAAGSFIPYLPMPDDECGGWAYGWHLQTGRWWGERVFIVARLDRLRYVDYTRNLDWSQSRGALGVDLYPQPLLVVKLEIDFTRSGLEEVHWGAVIGF